MARPEVLWHTRDRSLTRALLGWSHRMRRTRSSLVLLSLLLLFLFLLILVSACAEGGARAFAEPDAGTVSQSPVEPAPSATEKPGPTNPDDAAIPEVEAVSPNKATVGAVGPTIVVTGNNFVPRSIVQLDGAPLATSFVGVTELRATIPSNKLATVGTLRISVGTAPPGGGASREVNFTVENPVPQLTGLSPLSVVSGSDATDLEVTGLSFVPGAKIVFGGTDLVTTWTGNTQLKATIPSTLLGTSGSVPVTVVHPAPGGGASSPIAFTVSNPSASIQSINPSAAFVGSAAFEMTVSGSGFVAASTVLFNGVVLPTTFVSANQLKASASDASLTAAGDFPVAVQNPPPGGGVSAPVVFRVQYPVPTVTSVSPTSVSAGSPPIEVTVTGIGFFVTSQITFDNAPAATTYIDRTHVKATLSAAQLSSADSIAVRVVNPTPGGGSSSALPFTIMNGTPTITSLNPSSVVVGSPDRIVVVMGTGFVAGSSLKSNGQALSTTYTSGSQVSATIPASHMQNSGSLAITVTNPSPGGGTSSPAYLTVGCDSSTVDVRLGVIGTTYSFSTNFDGTNMMPRWSSAGSCGSATFYGDTQQPGRYAIVQNTTGSPIALSAWADCTNDGKGDAFLTFYRRSTIPTTDTERLACEAVIAEGTNASGGYGSPQSGGSSYCPGLTKANGGSLTLGICEKAVVHVQSYSYTSSTYTPPPTIRLRAE